MRLFPDIKKYLLELHELLWNHLSHYLERIGGKLIKTKFIAIVQSDPEGFKISVDELNFLDIVVEKPEDFESETRRILSEMLEIDEDSFELEFKSL